MSLANLGLSLNQPRLLETLPDGRQRISLRWKVSNDKTNSAKFAKEAFDPTLGVLMSKSFGGNDAPDYLTWPTAVLVKQEVRMPHFRTGEAEPDPHFALLEKIYEEAATVPTQYEPDQPITGPDNIQELETVWVMQAASVYRADAQGGVIGTSTHNGGILKSEKIEVDLAIRRIRRTYVTNGVFQARRIFKQNTGILLVEWRSIGLNPLTKAPYIPTALNGTMAGTNAYTGHVGGTSTNIAITQLDIKDIQGLQTYVVTVALTLAGGVISVAGSTTVVQYEDYIEYDMPGLASITTTPAIYTLSPPTPRYPLKVQITEYITNSNDPGTAPYFVKEWGSVWGSWTDANGNPHSFSKGLVGYLAGGSSAGTGPTTIAGQPGGTDYSFNSAGLPSPTQFESAASVGYGLCGAILKNKLGLAFCTVYGVQLYRRRTIQVVATTWGTYGPTSAPYDGH